MDSILDELHSEACFEIGPFSERAAIEAAVVTHQAIKMGDKRGGIGADWQKVKVDRQIVAIAKVLDVEIIYTTDSDVLKHAEVMELAAIHLADVLPPPEDQQHNLPFEELGQKTPATEPRAPFVSGSGDGSAQDQAEADTDEAKTGEKKERPSSGIQLEPE